MQALLRTPLFVLLGLCLSCLQGSRASAQVKAETMPLQLKDVSLDEKLGAEVPKELVFRDLDDQPIELGDLFDGKRPVLFTMNYATCPKLCGLQLDGLAKAMRESGLKLGHDFDMLTISLDPTEKAELTRTVKKGFMGKLGSDFGSEQWNFLRGDDASIRAVADAVGFQYQHDEESGEYLHPALAMVLSPDGKMMRYVRGLAPAKSDLRLAVREAADGKGGASLGDRLLLFCYSYDPETGSYTLAAWRLMRAGGVLTLLFLLTGFFALQRSKAREETQ